MTLRQVNFLNIALMLAATAVAFAVPFQLFLLAYAILGPLHYLTQISWLHSRSYFTPGKSDHLVLGAMTAVLLALKYVAVDRYGLVGVVPWAAGLVILSLAASAAMVLQSGLAARAALIAAAVAVAPLIVSGNAAQALLLTMLPTLIHVYCFTALFMLYGALRGRSPSGAAQLAVFVACSASFFLVGGGPSAMPGQYVHDTYEMFAPVNVSLAGFLGISGIDQPDAVYVSPAGVALMRFIAFAYTYHYLNWFSKTSVIQWHKVPRAWSIANIVLWIASVSLYAWDYGTGLIVLFSLSWLHVYLELPLDFRTAAGVGQELRSIAQGRSARVALGAAGQR
ncbi:MAG TPA: hypothetical protein VGK20_18240 [Candidatus Binatia bacterium]